VLDLSNNSVALLPDSLTSANLSHLYLAANPIVAKPYEVRGRLCGVRAPLRSRSPMFTTRKTHSEIRHLSFWNANATKPYS
jgi:hypothetical protein